MFTASEESEMKTCELTPFMGIPDSGSADDVPVIRSFLLRLLFNDRYYCTIDEVCKMCYVYLQLKTCTQVH